MAIEIEAPDGSVVEFPDGTPDADIKAAMKKKFAPMGFGAAAALGASQGVTLGFGDEIYGGVAGAYDALTSDKSFSDAYASRRDAARAAVDKARTDQPLAAYGGEIISGVAVPFGLARTAGKAALAAPRAFEAAGKVPGVSSGARALYATAQLPKNAGLGARMAAGAKEGAAWGGLYGLGAGEGNAEQQAASVLGGVALGGTFGAALPPVVDAGRALTRGVVSTARNRWAPESFAAEKYAQNIARDAGDSSSPDAIRRALDQYDAKLKLPTNANDPMMVGADLGGENVHGLIRAAVDTPNDAGTGWKRFLDRRQKVQWRNLESELAGSVGDPRRYKSTLDGISAARKETGEKLFGEASKQPFNIAPDSDLARMLSDRGYMRRLVEKTNENISGMTGKSADDVIALLGVKTPPSPAEVAEAAKLKATLGPVDRDTANSIYDMFKYTQAARQQKQPERLASFLVRTGGIADDGREIRHMVGRPKDRPGLVNQRGSSLDDAALRAWEQGYFPNHAERPSLREFLDALDDDLRGNPIYRAADAGASDDIAAANSIMEDLANYGITPDSSDRAVRAALGIKDGKAAQHSLSQQSGVNPWDFLHRVKMQIDTEIGNLKRGMPDNNAGWTIADLTKLKNEFAGALRGHNKQYGKALDAWAGDSAMMNALEDGREFGLKWDVEEIVDHMRGLTDGERQLFRIGALRALAKKADPKGETHNVTNMFRSHDMKARMQALFPDKASLRQFWRGLVREEKKAATRASGYGNSKTNKFQKFSEDSGDAALTSGAEMIDAAKNMSTGNVSGLLRNAAAWGRRFAFMSPDTAAETLRFARRPAQHGVPPELYGAVPRISRMSDPRYYDEALQAARGGFASGYGAFEFDE